MGTDPQYICWKPQKGSSAESPNPTPRASNEPSSSDEEDDDEEEASTSSHPQREDASVANATAPNEKKPIALVDYVLHVVCGLFYNILYAMERSINSPSSLLENTGEKIGNYVSKPFRL